MKFEFLSKFNKKEAEKSKEAISWDPEVKKDINQGTESKKYDQEKEVENKFNPKNIELAIKSDRPMEVKVKRTSGIVEDDWTISRRISDQEVMVVKSLDNGEVITKIVTLDDLRQWDVATVQRVEINPVGVHQQIANAKSFEDLIKVIDSAGGIQKSQEFIDAGQLKIIIDRVREGELSPSYITRTDGLRAKVIELMTGESRQKGILKQYR